MSKNDFYVKWSPLYRSFAVYDNIGRVLHGTDHSDKSMVEQTCRELNAGKGLEAYGYETAPEPGETTCKLCASSEQSRFILTTTPDTSNSAIITDVSVLYNAGIEASKIQEAMRKKWIGATVRYAKTTWHTKMIWQELPEK